MGRGELIKEEDKQGGVHRGGSNQGMRGAGEETSREGIELVKR